MSRILRKGLLSLVVFGLTAIWLAPGTDRAQGEAPDPPVPKVIRPACTDNVCGGCDGRCHDPAAQEYDHLTVRRNGHCTCTPRKGRALDQAIRQAYERWAEKSGR